MSEESRIDAILGEWRARGDAGDAVSPEDVIAAHPEIAESLRARFDALSALSASGQPSLRDVAPDRYADFRVLGQGGMGIVYWALDTDLNRQVAFKVVRPDAGQSGSPTPSAPIELSPPTGDTPASQAFATLKARFLQEAWVTAGLEHPGIVPVYEVGQTPEGVPYYTMRFVRGSRTLAAAVEGVRGKSIDERLALFEPFLKVCDTIRYAHAHGVIHRDLKPDNIALGEFGEVVVLDWGLAKMTGRPDALAEAWQHRLQEYRDAADLKTIASALGTPGYMSPEAALGRTAEVDARSDVYSLGAILFQLLTGRLPYDFASYGELAGKLMRTDAPRADAIDAAVPREPATIAARALSRDRAARTASAESLAAELRAWLRQRERDAETSALLREAEAAFEGMASETGDALLRRVDRLQSVCDRLLAVHPGHARGTAILDESRALRDRAIEGRERTARTRVAVRAAGFGVVMALTGATAFAVVMYRERTQLRATEKRLRVSGLVAESAVVQALDPLLSLRLADEAVRTARTPESLERLQAALQECPDHRVVASGLAGSPRVTFGAVGTSVLVSADGGTAIVRLDGRTVAVLPSEGGSSACWSASSRDGSRIVTHCVQGVDLWTGDGRHLAKLSGAPSGWPYHPPVAFGPKGDCIVGAVDGEVRRWDLDGTLIGRLDGRVDGDVVVVSPSGNRIVGIGRVRTVWDADFHVVGAPRTAGFAWDAAISPGGDRVLTHDCKRAQIETLGGVLVAMLPKAEGGVTAIGWPAPSVLWTLQGGRLRLFAPDASLRTETPAGEFVTAAAVSKDGSRTAAGADDGTIRVRTAEGELLDTLRGHRAAVTSVAFSYDGLQLASAAADGTVIVWQLRGRTPMRMQGRPAPVVRLDVLAGKQRVLVHGADGRAMLRDLDGSRCVVLGVGEGGISCVAASPDGETVATVGRDGLVHLWGADGTPRSFLRDPDGRIVAVALARGGVAATAAEGGSVRIWNPDRTQAAICAAKPEQGSTSIAISPNGKQVVSVVWSGLHLLVRAWNADGKLLADFSHSDGLPCLAFPDGADVYGIATDEGTVIVMSQASVVDVLPHSRKLRRPKSRTPADATFAFSPAGDRLLTPNDEDGAILVDVGGPVMRTIGTRGGHVRALAFSPRGDRVVIVGPDGIAELCAVSGERELLLGEAGSGLRCAAFSDDGKFVVTGSDDGAVRVWTTSADAALHAAAERRLPAWTDAERARFGDLLPPAPETDKARR